MCTGKKRLCWKKMSTKLQIILVDSIWSPLLHSEIKGQADNIKINYDWSEQLVGGAPSQYQYLFVRDTQRLK